VGLASFAWAGPVMGPRTEIAILPWPDGGAPVCPRDMERVLSYGLEATRAGRFVEIGCHAGHGRTGTALAALMILGGAGLDEALERVLADYCEFAVETIAQEHYLRELAHRVGGGTREPTRAV
jgi:protein-tyrosine phosphatase